MSIWVYINSQAGMWTTGFYDPSGEWNPDRDFTNPTDAAERVHWLNGGHGE